MSTRLRGHRLEIVGLWGGWRLLVKRRQGVVEGIQVGLDGTEINTENLLQYVSLIV